MAIKYIEVSATENGTYTDITDFIAHVGFKVQRNDVDAPDVGRSNLTGEMYRKRVAVKHRIDCTCKPLTQAQTQVLLPLIKPVFVYVNYLDPEVGWRTGVKMYSNNIPATSLIARERGSTTEYYWMDIVFPLVEA